MLVHGPGANQSGTNLGLLLGAYICNYLSHRKSKCNPYSDVTSLKCITLLPLLSTPGYLDFFVVKKEIPHIFGRSICFYKVILGFN